MSEPETMLQPGITVHCLVRNEERFIQPAILSILPLAQRVLVYDTGSTDGTLDILSSIEISLRGISESERRMAEPGSHETGNPSEKLQITRRNVLRPSELADVRNEMVERTTTEWFMLVDGDEIYPRQAIQNIHEQIQTVPSTIHHLLVHRRHLIQSFNFTSPMDRVGRIFRTSQIRWRSDDALPPYRPRAETAYLRDDPARSLEGCSMTLPPEIFFFHCQYLVRSSKDDELGSLRRWRWRKPPIPVRPYFGPWPETLRLDGTAHRMTPEIFWTWLGLNARIVKTWGVTCAQTFTRALKA